MATESIGTSVKMLVDSRCFIIFAKDDVFLQFTSIIEFLIQFGKFQAVSCHIFFYLGEYLPSPLFWYFPLELTPYGL